MIGSQKYDCSRLKNLKSIKKFCNSHLLDIATGALSSAHRSVKVRFIDSDNSFGYTGLGRFFFVDDCMYIMSRDQKHKSDHNPIILDFSEELEPLKHSGYFIVRVLFAGLYTGFLDDNGERIFTGDVVKARVFLNPETPSKGGTDRVINRDPKYRGSICESGVDYMFNRFVIKMDNCSVPLSWAMKLKIVGSLFFNLKNGETEVDIKNLCNGYAQARTDRKELRRLIKKSPYYPPVTWQEQAIELLCKSKEEAEREEEDDEDDDF